MLQPLMWLFFCQIGQESWISCGVSNGNEIFMNNLFNEDGWRWFKSETSKMKKIDAMFLIFITFCDKFSEFFS